MMSLLMKTDACTVESEPHDLDLWESLADFFTAGGGMGVMKVLDDRSAFHFKHYCT